MPTMGKTKTKSAKHSSLFITENILAPVKDQLWRLILSPDFYALLVANKQNGCYDAEITFDREIIQDFLSHLSTQLPSSHTLQQRLKLELHRDQRFNHRFVFELIKILVDNDQYISLQKSIGHKIPQQLSELLDPITTLLTLDRLFIYQLDTVNSIVYERLNPNLAIDFLSNLENQNDLVDLPHQIDSYRQGKTLVTNDIRQSNCSLDWQRSMDQLGVQSVVIIPILMEDQLWGLLTAHRRENVPNWNNHDLQILSMAAIAISSHFNHLKTNELLKRRNQKLEHKIIGQNQEIQDILITTQIAQDSKNDFLETMSHELRTPLTCVIGLSSTLLHWSLDPDNPLISFDKQRKYLQSIHDNGRHLLDLINNILDFS
ncbi:MAG: GAF domain-containing protein, partial [Synechococcaceae cyanobacterium RL_1_2]|nr:GAF domain-containing protein [Synechococcaceae cyanobacterium RL_1_2]